MVIFWFIVTGSAIALCGYLCLNDIKKNDLDYEVFLRGGICATIGLLAAIMLLALSHTEGHAIVDQRAFAGLVVLFATYGLAAYGSVCIMVSFATIAKKLHNN